MATKPRYLKTAVQLWIGDKRNDLGLTPADIARLTGVTEATARGWESRGRPSEALAILERRFGEKAPAEQTENYADLAKALFGLTDELQAARAERTSVAARLEEIEATLDALVGPAMQGEEVRPVPRESRG